MNRRPKALFLAAVATAALLGVSACNVLGSPSKVRAGELYLPGSARYDTYFNDVHAQQVAAANWPEDRKSARKPLLDALKLLPDADDTAIEQTTKDRLSAGMLRLDVQGSDVHIVETAASRHDNPREVLAAVEIAAHAEIERAKKLGELPARIELLAKTGRELEDHIAEDFAGNGQKPFDVREELRASYDVLLALSQGAAREKKDADQFIAGLGRAVSTGSEVPTTTPSPLSPPPRVKPAKPPAALKGEQRPDTATKPMTVAHGAEPGAPAPKPAPVAARVEPPAPKPAPPPPPPKPAAKPAETEVFNP
jgi:hypothetical protein